MSKNQEKIKAALQQIDESLETISTDEDWLRYLYFQSRFYNYSFGNTMLIYLQNRNATYVKGYKAWNTLGRYVRKGSKGLAILAPCIKKKLVSDEEDLENEVKKKVITGFRLVYVYDIADTDGDDSQLPVLITGLSGNSDEEKLIYEKLYEFISSKHIVQEVEGINSKGSYNLETRVITVKADMDYIQKAKTLLHEYSHLIDFEMNPDENISRNCRELIAESCAYVVASRLGLDTSRYSMSYIQSWLRDKDELRMIADTVQKVSYRIITELAGSSDSAFSILRESED